MPSGARRTAACLALLLLVNLWVCRDLFRTEYTVHLGSIEAAYVALSRYIIENWRDLTWFPLWYTGIPFQNAYSPLLHMIVALVAAAGGISPALAHHAVTAAFYCLGPVTLFWLALRLGADRITALVAGLVYSLFSPSAFLMPAVAADMGGVWNARRLHALVHYGEGPHISSMTLLPAALVLTGLALERRRIAWYVAAAMALAAVVLTNWLGGAALAAGAAAWLLTGQASRGTWLRAAALAVYAYLLASPWIPPSTLTAVRRNAQRVGGDYRMGPEHLLYWALLLAALILLERLLRRVCTSRLVRFAALFLMLVGGVTLAAAWFGVFLLPQPQRYHLEMEMALAPLLAAALGGLLRSKRRGVMVAASSLLLLLCAFQLRNYGRFAQQLIRPIRITETLEYQMATWFEQNMGGRRVMAPGSVSFWMNAFTDTPQLGGGFEQGITNAEIPAAIFQIYSGMNAGEREGEIALLWLKALGVHAVAVGGPESREFYKPFANPNKFRGLLEEIWREGDDVIYRVPQRSDSLARVVRKDQLLRRPLPTAVDVDPLRPFVAGLDDPALPLAQWQWLDRHRAVVTAQLQRDHVLSVAISYHPGWSVRVNGARRRISADGLGLMVIEPECEGPCRIELTYTGGLEMRLAKLASWGALLAGLIGVVAGRRRGAR